VAKGYSHRYGVDYEETFSPVVRHTSTRILIAMAVKNNLKIHQMDVVTGYLQSNLTENVYMEQPEGFSDESGRVCHLKKSIYGLKQAGKNWKRKLDAELINYGLTRSKLDPCVYYSKRDELTMAIYVDDFLIFYKNEKELNHLNAISTRNSK
jgi:Reverse transcriptase (RNA-dependent DNA polymerase)